MTRDELKNYITESFGVIPDTPWQDSPQTEVFRHSDNRKWFALIIDIPRRKLGIDDDTVIFVVNLKCDSMMLGSILREKGFYPAYHMNKSKWLTAALDGSADDDIIRMLVSQSYSLTATKLKRFGVNIQKAVERISKMESVFDTLLTAFEKCPSLIVNNKSYLKMYRRLVRYYDNGQWRKDFELDEKGMLPLDLKRGVLSEDGIYNFISDVKNTIV